MGGGDHLRAGQTGLAEDTIPGEHGQGGQEEEQATKLGSKLARLKVEGADVSDVGRGRAWPGWPFFVEPAWQASEAFVGQEDGDSGGAEGMSFGVESLTDVIDGEVLLAQGDDPLAE